MKTMKFGPMMLSLTQYHRWCACQPEPTELVDSWTVKIVDTWPNFIKKTMPLSHAFGLFFSLFSSLAFGCLNQLVKRLKSLKAH